MRIIARPDQLPFAEPEIPGWFSRGEMALVYECIQAIQARQCLEIGTYMGRSAFAICSALQNLGPEERGVLCIDTFASPISEDYFKRDFMISLMSRFPSVKDQYSDWRRRPTTLDCLKLTMERYPFMQRLVTPQIFDSASFDFSSREFDFALIDGAHTYDGVRDDFFNVAPSVREGGIICFHGNSEHFPGVRDFIAELRLRADCELVGQADTACAFVVKKRMVRTHAGRSHMDVVLNFHRGDQRSARVLLKLLCAVDEGIDCTYHLQYGSSPEAMLAAPEVLRFLETKDARFSCDLPDIEVPREMIDDDPNLREYGGLQAKRTKGQKKSILQWNLCVHKYIQSLDSFLMIEPDCVVLKEGWLADIHAGWQQSDTPIFGHIKRGTIGGRSWFTHWAGCSVYNSGELRRLPLEQWFKLRYENPWWPMRELPDTINANNCFFGPAFSGYDVSYDYFLFALYFREKTGSNDPRDWPLDQLRSREDLIYCDFHSSKTADEIEALFSGQLPLLHGVKDDLIRERMLRRFAYCRAAAAPYSGVKGGFAPTVLAELPVGGPAESFVGQNERLLSLDDLKGRFAGRRCFIIGNGPSLQKTDLRLLANEYTIGLNRIYLNSEKMGFETTFLCVVNPNVLAQFGNDIARLRSIKFLRYESRKHVPSRWNTFFMESYGAHEFNTDLRDLRWCEGWTVTYAAMQLAHFLGFDEVVLVGVDHNFVVSGDPNKLDTAAGPDLNHFHAEYFGKGVKWDFPDLARSEESYKVARRVFEQSGRKIVDATVGGKLTVFPKVEFGALFQSNQSYSVDHSPQRALQANAGSAANSVKMANGRNLQNVASERLESRRECVSRTRSRLGSFEGKHSGERCVIIGNGPSLNKMDLRFLSREITFGMNRIYLGFDRWDFKPKYYACVNPLVIDQSWQHIARVPAPKFLSCHAISYLGDREDCLFIESTGGPNFGRDPRVGLWEGYTVTFFALQLAYFMGFDEVILIGVDHLFSTQGPSNAAVLSQGPDPNHFDQDYFGKGTRWHLPDLEKSEAAYRLARIAFEDDRRVVLDATLDGHLTVFPKVDYREVFYAS